jgi:hypothetical protein
MVRHFDNRQNMWSERGQSIAVGIKPASMIEHGATGAR